ncbi:MAG: HesA/MoeB/ThiF family protein [Anaerolineae bacterium]
MSRRQVELVALEEGILPERYRRSYGTIGLEGQLALARATVGVVGAGGLGGWIVDALARMGVGRLIIIDGDRFEENNLNRQAGCTEATIGHNKAQVVAERAVLVNAAVEATAHVAWLTAENAVTLLAGSAIVVDALDTLPARMVLQQAAQALGIPMVHGAIAGYTGQVTVVYPGDAGLVSIYGPGPWRERGAEITQGNPAATPMMVAAWQVSQVIKYLTGKERGLLRNRLLLLDSQAGDVTILELGA